MRQDQKDYATASVDARVRIALRRTVCENSGEVVDQSSEATAITEKVRLLSRAFEFASEVGRSTRRVRPEVGRAKVGCRSQIFRSVRDSVVQLCATREPLRAWDHFHVVSPVHAGSWKERSGRRTADARERNRQRR